MLVYPFSVICVDKDIETVSCSNERGCGVVVVLSQLCRSCATMLKLTSTSLLPIAWFRGTFSIFAHPWE